MHTCLFSQHDILHCEVAHGECVPLEHDLLEHDLFDHELLDHDLFGAFVALEQVGGAGTYDLVDRTQVPSAASPVYGFDFDYDQLAPQEMVVA